MIFEFRVPSVKAGLNEIAKRLSEEAASARSMANVPNQAQTTRKCHIERAAAFEAAATLLNCSRIVVTGVSIQALEDLQDSLRMIPRSVEDSIFLGHLSSYVHHLKSKEPE